MNDRYSTAVNDSNVPNAALARVRQVMHSNATGDHQPMGDPA
jgi:hypothetical protein